MIDPTLEACLHHSWLGWYKSERGVDALFDVRAEAANAARRRDGSHPIVAGIRNGVVDAPIYRGIAMIPGDDPFHLRTLRLGEKLEMPPVSFSKSIDVALCFSLFGADRPTIPIVLKITSSRVDQKINGIDLTEYSGAAVEQEVMSGGHFVVTGIHEVPGLVGFEKKGPLGMLTLCQMKVH